MLVKELAQQCGFALAGIARLDPSRWEQQYREWLAHGYHGTMGYLERNLEERFDPRRLMPEARSVLVLGVPYGTYGQAPADAAHGLVSNYAWGEDYHRIIRQRLEMLIARLQEAFPGVVSRAFVDTGPVLERELAQRAGLGWIGKHTLVLNREQGSYFFLAEVFLSLDLPPDAPVTDHCGTCTACLDACPTNAFPQAGVLDASRCISYLTIEHRGLIAEEFHEAMGSWVYGCDLCQQVCPWNQKAPGSTDPAWQPRPFWREPSLIELAQMSQEQYESETQRSAMKRAKRTGLRRNAVIALGNVQRSAHDFEVQTVLQELTDDADPLVAATARQLL